MAQSPDHPQLLFVQAKGYTEGRPDGPPLWIVVHDMETSETSTRAENTAAYFANPGDGRSVSSHYCADNNSVVQCVLLRDSAWTVGNRPGNNRGINWEFAGFIAQSREQWLDPFGLAMFAQAAPIIRADAAKYGIPLERRTVAELQAFKPGVTSHNDLRLAFGGTTHTDPGPNFPWPEFMAIIQGDDVAFGDDEAKQLEATNARVRALAQLRPKIRVTWDPEHPTGYEDVPAVVLLTEMAAKIDALATASGVDLAALKAVVDASIAEATPAIADAVGDEIAAGLTD